MAKKVFYDDDARKRVLGGAEILYNAVKTTMGPKGRNVVISKSFGSPTVTHDGVTVAKGVDIADVDDETLGYKVGAELIKQAALRGTWSVGTWGGEPGGDFARIWRRSGLEVDPGPGCCGVCAPGGCGGRA